VLRVLFFFVLVLGFAFGFAWLADRPGTVAIDWMGYQIELSAMVASIALAVLIVVVMLAWWVIKLVLRSPQIMGGYFSVRKRDKAYEAVSSGLVAAGSGDKAAAQRYAKQAQKLAPDAPLTRVLAASSADLSGESDAKRGSYRKMLDDPKTQLLGLRGLYLDAVQDDDEEAARHYASQAAALAPALPWAGQAQFEDQVQRSDWPAARAALERNLQQRIVTKTDRNRLRAVLLTAEAIDREQGEPDAARALAQEAHKLAPDLVPAACAAGRLLIRAGKMTAASKVIESTWKKQPHPELAETYLYVRPGDAVADRVKRARKLAQLSMHDREGELALARALIEAGDLDGARNALEPFADQDATQRVCLLMAEIEEKQGGDTAAVRGWMARALRAKRDPAWVADGYISSTWEPVSPLSGRVDAFAWKVPVERFAAHEPVAMPDNAISDDGQLMLPARLPGLVAAGVAGTSVETAGTEETDQTKPTAVVEDAALEVEAIQVEAPKADADNASSNTSVSEAEETSNPGEPTDVDHNGRDASTARTDGSDDGAKEREETPAVSVPTVANDDEAAAAPASSVAPVAANTDEPAQVRAGDNSGKDAASAPGAVQDDAPDAGGNEDGKQPYTGLPRGHAPDDPGPQDEATSESQRKRFRLF
jgi:HemY protein